VKRLILVAALVLVASLGYRGFLSSETGTGDLTLPQPFPNQGQMAPDFASEDIDGSSFDLPQEGVQVITFWSTLNRGTNLSHQAFGELADEYEDDEVSFAAIYVSSVPQQDQEEAPYAVLRDHSGELTSMYNVKRVPRIFLIEDGEIRLVQNGYNREHERELKEALEELTEAREA
jgi:peroxiredoxin